MSRIAGIYNKTGKLEKFFLNKMLTAIESGKHLKKCFQEFGAFSCSWIGWDDPKIKKFNNCIIQLDGYIYNRNEWDKNFSVLELIYSLYNQYGFDKMLSLLNGDFIISLYDISKNTLMIARDRIGLKPLYYIDTPHYFVYASRIKSLLQIPGVSKEPRKEFIVRFAGSHYRTFDNDIDRSPFEKIYQLPQAHVLMIKGNNIKIYPYWKLKDNSVTGSLEDLADQYRELLLNAVDMRMKEAKRPGFTLSGGMDSSSVMASAVKGSGKKQHAFSTVYADKTYDESEDIKSMIGECVQEWHKVSIPDHPDVFSLIEKMIKIHDEPVATATWLSHYILCQEAKQQGFKSLFGGLGGDELNAGEYEHFYYFFADLRKAGDEDRLKDEVKWWCHYHDHPIYKKDFKLVEDRLNRIVDLNVPGKCLPDFERIMCYANAINPDYFDLRKYIPIMDHPFSSYLKNRTYQDMMRETIPCCLRSEDRQTVAYGLDNFLPFFDYKLIEFMFNVPTQIKYNKGVAKHLLREAMKGVLPEETRTRVQKTGWNAPAHIWFSGKGQEPLRDLIASQSFRNRGIYNLKEVKRLLNEHEEIISTGVHKENHMMFFWQLVNLEKWLQSLKD